MTIPASLRSAPWLAAACAAGLAAAHLFAAPPCGCTATCTGPRCVPGCKATWEEAKTPGRPRYSLECEYACARGRDSWHSPAPECRCSPPCGRVYVKKRLYKEPGEEQVERVPKYDVVAVPAPRDCGRRTCWDTLCGWLGW